MHERDSTLEALERKSGRPDGDGSDMSRGEMMKILVEGCRVSKWQAGGQEEDLRAG